MLQPLTTGTVLDGHYVIEQVIGQGTIGYVYCCKDKNTGQNVAIKEAAPRFCTRINNDIGTRLSVYNSQKNIDNDNINIDSKFEIMKNNLRREAELLSQLTHCPYLVSLYDLFEENNTVYMVMEFLNGETMRSYLRRGIVLTEEEIRLFGLLLLKPLSYLHGKGLVHLDVCPENVMITDNLKLIDYGFAYHYLENQERSINFRLGYTAPEQYHKNGKIGPWSDLYSVGAILYELTTGKKPLNALARLGKDVLPSPRSVRGEISNDLNEIILKSLSLNPNQRFQNTDAFEQSLLADGENRENIKKTVITEVIVSAAVAVFWLFLGK